MNITNIGISIILLYSIIQILNFYGIGVSVYGTYISFYIFLLLSTFILPNEYPKLT
jgi:hypothetical protein